MAGGGIPVGPGKGGNYPGKMTFRVFVACLSAATGGLIFGYDLGVSGGVTSMDSFLKVFFPTVYAKESSMKPSDNQYCKFDSQTLTFFTSSLYLAALVASWFCSAITRKFGRRATMLLGGVLFFAGAGLNAFSSRVWMLYVGRALLGLGIGCANQSVPIYVSEMAPFRYRGALNILFQLSITVGILFASVMNYYFAKLQGGWGWRLSLGMAGLPAVIIILSSIFLSDTPNSLIERGHIEEAKDLLIKIRGVADVEEEFQDLVAASEASKLVKHPWINIWKRKYRPQLIFSFMIPFFQQFTGINVFIFYAPVLFKTVGFGASASLMSTVITNGVNMVATLVSIYGVDKWGRRTLFIMGGIQMFLCQIVITGMIAYKFGLSGNPGELPLWYVWTLVAAMCVFVAGFAWSWGPLGWLIPSEIFPLEIRSAAQSINVSVNMFCTFAVAQVFTAMLCHLKFGLFIFFSAFVLIMTIFIYKTLPETKGIPIEEMSKVWKEHKVWRKYVTTDKEVEMEKP